MTFTRMLLTRTLLPACFLAGTAGLWLAAWHTAQQPGWLAGIVALVLALGGLRLLYEATFNRSHIPTIASAPAVRRAMIEQLRAHQDVQGGTCRIVDLGAGKGELARAIARALPSALVTAVERAWPPHLWLRAAQALFGPRNLQPMRDDLFACDCGQAQAVVLFVGRLTEAVGVKLWAELAPDSLVISNAFELRGSWPMPDVITVQTPFTTRLFVYRRP